MNVRGLIGAFLEDAGRYYRFDDGKPTGEAANLASTLSDLSALSGDLELDRFGAPELIAWRALLISRGLGRSTINKYVGMVRRAWRWGVERRLANPEHLQAIEAVRSLRQGAYGVRETSPVSPVEPERVYAVLPNLAPNVAELVRLLMATGMRPGEARVMRDRDLENRGDRVIYRPSQHKNARRGHTRSVPLNAAALEIVERRLSRVPRGYLFGPDDTGLKPYAAVSLAQNVRRACERARVRAWSLNQIRHTVGQVLSDDEGIEAARAALGHRDSRTTRIYASDDTTAAARALDRLNIDRPMLRLTHAAG